MEAARASAKRKRAANGTKRRKRRPVQVEKSIARLLTGEEDEPKQIPPTEEPPATIVPASNGTVNSVENVSSESEDTSSAVASDDEPAVDTTTEAAKPLPISNAQVPNVNVIVLLEGANLETVKVPGRTSGLALLNSDDHAHILRKTRRNANDARPDIVHQCLLTLLDSPLNKAGRLKVYIRSARNVLIEVHPQTRVPRTARRFYGLMAELLTKFKVRGTSGSEPLFRVIRNPITSHLPVDTRKIVCTYNCDNVVDVREHAGNIGKLAPTVPAVSKQDDKEKDAQTVLYVVGALAHGKVTEEWAEENICISEYPLSAATVCARITYAYECLLGIL